MRFKLSFTIILLFALRAISKKTTIQFLGVNVTVNPAYINLCTMVIQPDKESLAIDIILGRNLDPNIRSYISFSGNLQSHKDSTPEFQFDLPICQIINNGMKAKSHIVTNSFKNIFKQGNLPAKCPFLAGNYTWRNFRPRQEHMPNFALGGVFRLVVRFYSNRDMPNIHSSDAFVEKGGKVYIHTTSLSFTLK